MITKPLFLTVCLATLLWSTHAAAFCGMYVSKKEDAELLNEATQVVLFRDGLTTAVTMQNSYKGPVDDFAMLVPVPQVLEKKDVDTLDPETLSRLAAFTSPRLSAYEKRVRCNEEPTKQSTAKIKGPTSTVSERSGASLKRAIGDHVIVRERFDAGEYEVEMLEASDSVGLMQWLEDHSYNIPDGGKELLQGYINAGMYFFVAKVDATKVIFDKKGRAELSPLKFTYSSKDFSLPVRLGMVNADGPQDLLIHTISPQGRYESSNYLTGIMPTNLIVESKVQENFASFYTSLYARVRQKREVTLMTEFVGVSSGFQKCDPCVTSDSKLHSSMLLPFIELGEDLYSSHYSTGVQVTSGKGMIRRELRRQLERAIRRRCFDAETMPLDGVTGLYAVQHITIEARPGTPRLTWTFGEREGFDPVSASDLIAYQTCLDNVLSELSESPVFEVSSNETYTLGIRNRLARTREFTGEQVAMMAKLTVTRLRGTFTPKETTEDIVFTLDDPLAGGYGEPYLADDTMPSFFAEMERGTSQFQTRYIIIESDIEAQTRRCDKVLGWSVYWTNPSSATLSAWHRNTGGKTEFTTKQLRRLIHNEQEAGSSL